MQGLDIWGVHVSSKLFGFRFVEARVTKLLTGKNSVLKSFKLVFSTAANRIKSHQIASNRIKSPGNKWNSVKSHQLLNGLKLKRV